MNPLERLEPAELGRRLKAARNASSVTQEQAATHIGAVRTTVVAIERGDRRLSAEELLRLCDLYATSPGQLLRPEAIHVDLALQFRRLPGGEADQEVLDVTRTLQELACRYVELERRLGRSLEPAYPPVRRLTRSNLLEQAEDLALELRSRLGIGLSPIPDVLSLVETELRVRLFVVPLPSRISGAYAYHEDLGACILVNANHAPTRQAWTTAHELGHFLTDRQTAEVLDGRTGDDLPGEQFANLFAGAFLMPASAIRRRYDEIWEGQGKFSARNLVYLARAFYVSPEAMARRLEVLGLFAKGTYDILRSRGLDRAAVRTLRSKLEEGAARPAFLPRYTLITVEAYEKELISEGELARMLRIGRVEVRELLDTLQDITDTVEEQQRARA